MNRTIRRRLIPDHEFLRVWRSCESPQQVETRLGMARNSANRRAIEMRKRGVAVPAQEVSP